MGNAVVKEYSIQSAQSQLISYINFLDEENWYPLGEIESKQEV